MLSEYLRKSQVQKKIVTNDDLKNFQKVQEIIIEKKDWDVLYENKIQKNLKDSDKFKFSEMNYLLNAYEQWRYEQMEKKKNDISSRNSILSNRACDERDDSVLSKFRQESSSSSSDSKSQSESQILLSTKSEDMRNFNQNITQELDMIRAGKWIGKCKNIINSDNYTTTAHVVNIVQLFFILVIQIKFVSKGAVYAWIQIQVMINFFQAVELLSDFFIYGFKNSIKIGYRTKVELLCQCINFYTFKSLVMESSVTQVNFYTNIQKSYEVIIFIRLLKIFELLYEIKTLRIIVETLRNLAKPLTQVAGILFVIMYIFSQLGIYFFGGLNTIDAISVSLDPNIPQFYNLMNFNDFISSFITLYALMIVNNWMDIVEVYVDVTGSNWVKWFFFFFYYFAVVIGVNIVVAFSIDMYDSVARLDEERQNTVEILQKELKDEIEKHNLQLSQISSGSRKSSNRSLRISKSKIDLGGLKKAKTQK